MDVILLERIDRLGQMGDGVVNVKPGLRAELFVPAEEGAARQQGENRTYFRLPPKVELEATNIKRRDEAQGVAKRKMDGLKVVLVRQAGEGGQLYGSVSARDLAEALTADGYHIERGQVLLNAPVKILGVFKTQIRLHPEVKVEVEFTVARSKEEADLQAAEAAKLLERTEDAEKLLADADDDAEGEADDATEDSRRQLIYFRNQ